MSKKRKWNKKDKQKLIIIICIALFCGIIVRILGPRNGIMLCVVLVIGFFGIRHEIRKMRDGDDNEEDDEEE